MEPNLNYCNSHARSADTRDVKNALINRWNFVPLTLLLFHLIISLAIHTFILTFSQLHEVLYTNMIILCLKIVILYRLKNYIVFQKKYPTLTNQFVWKFCFIDLLYGTEPTKMHACSLVFSDN